MNDIELTKEDYEFLEDMRQEKELVEGCWFGINCINCGKTAMYANPKNFEGMQLPDMVCLTCKKHWEE